MSPGHLGEEFDEVARPGRAGLHKILPALPCEAWCGWVRACVRACVCARACFTCVRETRRLHKEAGARRRFHNRRSCHKPENPPKKAGFRRSFNYHGCAATASRVTPQGRRRRADSTGGKGSNRRPAASRPVPLPTRLDRHPTRVGAGAGARGCVRAHARACVCVCVRACVLPCAGAGAGAGVYVRARVGACGWVRACVTVHVHVRACVRL